MSDQRDARLLVLISGNGSNLQALIDSCNTPRLPNSTIVRVISNRKNAYGLVRAEKASIPTAYHNLVKYKKHHAGNDEGVRLARVAYDIDLAGLIVKDKPDLVICAGWMHILSANFIEALAAADISIINLHPALPGQFNGAGAIHRAFEAFHRQEIDHTGIMIHHVIDEVDMGTPIVIRKIPIAAGDSEKELEDKIHTIEWELIVEGTAKAIAERRGQKANHPDIIEETITGRRI